MFYSEPEYIPYRTPVYPLLETWHIQKQAVDVLFNRECTMLPILAPFIHTMTPNSRIYPMSKKMKMALKVYYLGSRL